MQCYSIWNRRKEIFFLIEVLHFLTSRIIKHFISKSKKKNIYNLDLEYRYTIYNSYNEEIGFTKSQFLSLIKRKHSINNFENEALYNIEKSCLFPKRYTIKVNNISSEVSALDATLYAAINDSIISKTNNSSSKK